MSPRRKLLVVVAVEVLAVLALVAFLVGVLLRAPAPIPGLFTAVITPSPGPSLTAPAAGTQPPPATSAASQTPAAGIATPTPGSTGASPAPAVSATGAVSPTASTAVSSTVTAQVIASGGGLRLRQSPGTAGAVLDSLSALDLLQVIGRTADNAWYQVIAPSGKQGWVNAVWVAVTGDMQTVAVTGRAVDAPVTTVSYLTGITAHARQIFLAGQAMGNQADVFSKVGDSNTDNPAFLNPFDLGDYSLGPYSDLEPTIGYFKGSFSRLSDAAVGGYSTAKALDPKQARPGCAGGETPLACEYRINKPSVALILLGTGDQHSWQGFEARYRTIIEYTIQHGIVPVLMTKADDLESKEDTAPVGFTNDTIRRLALEYDVPLLDLRQAVDPLPNKGCKADGFHYNSPPDGQTANFDAAHMIYGFNMRNLTALQALDALRKYVLY
jgi:hypothetical protein